MLARHAKALVDVVRTVVAVPPGRTSAVVCVRGYVGQRRGAPAPVHARVAHALVDIDIAVVPYPTRSLRAVADVCVYCDGCRAV